MTSAPLPPSASAQVAEHAPVPPSALISGDAVLSGQGAVQAVTTVMSATPVEGPGGGPETAGESSAWEAVVAAVDSGDPEQVAACVLALDDRARREVAALLPGHISVAQSRAVARRVKREDRHRLSNEAAWRRHVARAGRVVHEYERYQWDAPWSAVRQPMPDESWAGPLRVAGAGVIGGAAAVLAWLNRRDLEQPWNEPDADHVVERVLAERPPAWQADFAVRAALRLRPVPRGSRRAVSGARLALAMLRRSGATPPEHDPLVPAWAAVAPTAAALRDDPLLAHLLPRLFEAEGVGAVLRDEPAGEPPPASWLAALTELERTGRIGRDQLLDGCLRRFLRGGAAPDLRFFVRLHELLDPSPDEVRARCRDYLRLLPAAPGPVAEMALRHVRRLGDLDPADRAEAIRALLLRSERKLVTAGLAWLDQVARDPAADLDALAPALAYAFACGSSDVQGRAVRMAVKHAKRFTAVGAEAIRDAVGVLPPELGETLVALFGGEAAEADADGFTPVPLPRPRRSGPFAAPVAAVRDLDDRPGGSSWEAAERWLAGIVRLHAETPDALAARLATEPMRPQPPAGPWTHVERWSEEIARLIVTRAGLDPRTRSTAPIRAPGSGGPAGGAAHRLRGPGAHKNRPDEPADPSGGDGSPPGGPAGSSGGDGNRPGGPAGSSGGATSRLGELVWPVAGAAGRPERLAGPAEAGAPVEAVRHGESRLPADVPAPHLFLLRRWAEVYDAIEAEALPPRLLAEPIADTGHLDAAELVDRLAGYERDGIDPLPADLQQALLRLPRAIPPDVAERAARLTSEAGRAAASWMSGRRPEAVASEIAWRFDAGGTLRLVPRVQVTAPSGLPLVDALLADPGEHPREDSGGTLRWWPYVMPSDREVVAAHLVPHLADLWEPGGVESSAAWALARTDGPAGEAVGLVHAYVVGERAWSTPEERARVVVEAAARGDLGAEALGRQLALLVHLTWLKPGPVFEALETAASLGAHREVWRIMTGFLPAFLPGPDKRPTTRHAQALAFAVRAAQWAGARGALPCVTEIAERRASSTFVRHARRLHTYLT
ncbi:hypothetical protein E1286_46565 [Nonomuraea terrae]|uniref:HEAT repeat domain-containing protein n=1 Tax=Nonomuraea terrae TaxID=2530383 RepID=A0A4R4XET0_9ACTN|nr:DUF6493 family protein [Nonomuraea terrae]TDD29190.1 hypothetical protein E1286_46565 [Nonomuraea terrae]